MEQLEAATGLTQGTVSHQLRPELIAAVRHRHEHVIGFVASSPNRAPAVRA